MPKYGVTTVKVSKETTRKLAALQDSLHVRSLEETINLLVKRHRNELLDEAFGADRRRITAFSEDDRGEGRS
jgi:hypothetical protein